MKSLSEIETTSKRATRAAGFSWGVSEEVGKGIRLLELFGLPGIKNLNFYFKEKNLNDFENLKIVHKMNSPEKNTFCPINLGVSILDQIRTIETFKKCSFKNIAYPILLLPFLSRASEIVGKKIEFNFDKSKNLILIYMESFENIFSNEEIFGENLIKDISNYKKDNSY